MFLLIRGKTDANGVIYIKRFIKSCCGINFAAPQQINFDIKFGENKWQPLLNAYQQY